MGGCESCVSGRHKAAYCVLNDATEKGNLAKLLEAIKKAEAEGVDTLAARKHFSELAKQERQSVERVSEMVRWGVVTQDGVILHSVVQEASQLDPEHEDLPLARIKLRELQDDARIRLLRLSRQGDVQGWEVALNRARQMGIPPEELVRFERALAKLEQGLGNDAAGGKRFSRRLSVNNEQQICLGTGAHQ